jgi:sulfate adenylyltransferase subunit 2
MKLLDQLEMESIGILRETAACFRKPVLMYSVGKDSSVLLHLLLKAFAPARPTIPLLHVDEAWEFRETLEFRDRRAVETGVDLIVHCNREGLARGINPFDHGASLHTDVMKTEALKQALALHGFDAAIGGARRDEESSRSKERVFSLRSAGQRWDPRRQRLEPWGLCNASMAGGESMRVFPLSNWTELDVWLYIRHEGIPLVPLYFAKERPVVVRGDALIVVDDPERMRFLPGERAEARRVRFRTLGCWPLTGAIESAADSVDTVIAEMLAVRSSERQGRLIDRDPADSMERKKREGYF